MGTDDQNFDWEPWPSRLCLEHLHLQYIRKYAEMEDIETDFDEEIEECLTTGIICREEKTMALEAKKRALDKQYGYGFEYRESILK